MASHSDPLALVAQIAASYLRRNSIAVDQISTVVRNVTAALGEAQQQLGAAGEPGTGAGAASQAAQPEQRAEPAVPLDQSVQRDYLVCLEDGQMVRTLKRHLQSAHGMTPQQYRAKWNLPRDYPMSAPAYSESRSALAKARGLGRKEATGASRAAAVSRSAGTAERGQSRRGRKKK
jgi:predicted transcriptional regulator